MLENKRHYTKINRPFEILSTIDKEEIIRLFSEHEATRPIEPDTFALGRIEALKANGSTNFFFKVRFGAGIHESLMLPHHVHPNEIIPPFGKNISESLDLFSNKAIESPNSECIVKVKMMKKKYFNSASTDWSCDFILIGNNNELAHPGSHYSSNTTERLFIFNAFHRLMAYFYEYRN